MIEVKKYNKENKFEWDAIVKNSKNGTFILQRDYMDYHSHLFVDFSLVIYKKGKIEAVIPGNRMNNIFYSHQGLTYGGLLCSHRITVQDVLNIFDLIDDFLLQSGIEEVVYKPIPYIYHLLPSQEDIYALFRRNAQKIICNISSTIYQNNKLKFIESRKSGIRKAISSNLKIVESSNFHDFWNILVENLHKSHGVRPVHTCDEIIYLSDKFPDSIKLYLVQSDKRIFAGTVLYITPMVVHVQYISANLEGKENGSLDFLFFELINNIFKSIPYFDFGHSTESNGNILNNKLIFQKEGFGGRGVVYDIYRYSLLKS
jgi:hypothetical protein